MCAPPRVGRGLAGGVGSCLIGRRAGLHVHPWDLTTGWTEVLLDRHSPWWVGRCTSSDVSASGTWDLLVQTLNPFWRVLLWAMRAGPCGPGHAMSQSSP